MKSKKSDIVFQNKVFVWLALGTAAILLIPLFMMQISSEWNWDFPDFVVIGALLYGAGFTFVQVAGKTPKKYRTLIGIGFVFAVFYVWAEFAVGIFTNIGS